MTNYGIDARMVFDQNGQHLGDVPTQLAQKVSYLLPSGDTTGVTDTSAIQTALNGNSQVIIGKGTFYITKLTVPSNSALIGSGKGTILKSINNNSNTTALIETIDQAYNVNISNFVLDGNSSNNTNSFEGIHIKCTSNNNMVQFDIMNTVRDVYIKSIVGHGADVDQYARGCVFDNVVVYYSNSRGFYIKGTDNFFNACITGTTGQEGFYIDTTANSNKFSICKSFLAGNITANCSGFLINGTVNNFVGCEAQQNNYHGIEIVGSHNNISGSTSSNNGCIGTDSAAIKITGSTNVVHVTITSDSLYSKQKYGIYIDTHSYGNDIKAVAKEITIPNPPSTLPSMVLINDYNNFTNNVVMNGENYSSSYTTTPLDLTTGTSFQTDATGNYSLDATNTILTINTSNYSGLSYDWGSKFIKSFPVSSLTGKTTLVIRLKCKTSTKEMTAGIRAYVNNSTWYRESFALAIGRTDSSEYRNVYLTLDLATIGTITSLSLYFVSYRNNGSATVNNATAMFKDIVYSIV